MSHVRKGTSRSTPAERPIAHVVPSRWMARKGKQSARAPRKAITGTEYDDKTTTAAAAAAEGDFKRG